MDWNAMTHEAGVIDDGCLKDVPVAPVRTCGSVEKAHDIVICPTADVARRLASARQVGRDVKPERTYLARALSRDAGTAAAMLVRGVIGKWISLRGWRGSHDEHETAALRAIDEHLIAMGIPVADINRSGAQVPALHIVAPVKHQSPADAVRKAMAQLGRQFEGRTAIVYSQGPSACSA